LTYILAFTKLATVNTKFPRRAARAATKLLKAMGNEHRLLVLCHLLDGEKRVGELEKLTGLSQSALSQHLARLRSQRLVSTRRESQAIHYALASFEVDQMIHLLHGLYCAAPDKAAEPRQGTSDRRPSRRAKEEASP
jgi:ArsR family transcriptional regulator, virulence genes transcriptional regulator